MSIESLVIELNFYSGLSKASEDAILRLINSRVQIPKELAEVLDPKDLPQTLSVLELLNSVFESSKSTDEPSTLALKKVEGENIFFIKGTKSS